MWKNTRNAFYKMHAGRNSCSKGIIDRSKSALAKAGKTCIFLVPNAEKQQKCFFKTCGVHNSCLKGNIDRSEIALAETDKI